MAERIVDAAVAHDFVTALFFLTDHYVAYDFAADRVRDGVHPLGSLPPGSASGLPSSFAPPGSATSVAAALRGKHAFASFSYFFGIGEYMRLRHEAPAVFDPSEPQSVDLWKLPAAFATPDAAFNGALNRDPYAYFFGGSEYVRYRWNPGAVDEGYPKPISNMIGIPAAFAAGVDAAVDGVGAFANVSYLFKEGSYLRFQWVDGAAEPYGDGGLRSIRDNWLGLEAMLLAGKATASALEWVAVARALLDGLAAGSLAPGDTTLATAALATHFHLAPGDALLAEVRSTFAAIEATLRSSARLFRFRTEEEVALDGADAGWRAYTSPRAPSPNPRINFTRAFADLPLLNRISVLVHESVHVIDGESSKRETHIPEWYLTPAGAAAFGLTFQADRPEDFATRYDLMPAADAIHAPAAYATFARHVALRVDTRELP